MLNYDRKVPDRKYIDTGWSVPEFFASHRTINHRYKLTIFDIHQTGATLNSMTMYPRSGITTHSSTTNTPEKSARPGPRTGYIHWCLMD